MNSPKLTITSKLHLGRGQHGRVEMKPQSPAAPPSAPAGRVPRISRLMALAIRFDEMLRKGEVKDLADIARLGHVTRARATQILNLTMLAPDLQEKLLFLPPTEHGRDALKEWMVRPVAAEPVWGRQRRMWRTLQRDVEEAVEGAQKPRGACREGLAPYLGAVGGADLDLVLLHHWVSCGRGRGAGRPRGVPAPRAHVSVTGATHQVINPAAAQGGQIRSVYCGRGAA